MHEYPEPKRSASYIAAEAMLPEQLHPIFKRLVVEYQFAALKTHGYAMVSPKVIAELVQMGWRSPTPEDDKPSLK